MFYVKKMLRKETFPLSGLGRIAGLCDLAEESNNPNRSRSRQSLGWRLFNTAFTKLNRRIAWHKLPPLVGVLNLLAFRNLLREQTCMTLPT